MDFATDKVFCSDQLRETDQAELVFMVAGFLDKKALDKLKKDNVVHFYEYMNKALPRGINGKPMFMSCHMLTKKDYAMLRKLESNIRGAMVKAVS